MHKGIRKSIISHGPAERARLIANGTIRPYNWRGQVTELLRKGFVFAAEAMYNDYSYREEKERMA